MKIAFFCDAYKPTRSGVAVSVDTFTSSLRALGHEVHIYAPRYTNYIDDDPQVTRFPAGHWFRARDFPVTWPVLPALQLGLEAEFARHRFDLVHTHSPFTLGSLGASWVHHVRRGQRRRLPLLFTFHTLYHHYLHYAPLPREVARGYTLWRVGLHVQRCDHIICPSRPIEKIVHRLWPRSRTTVLPTGVDTDFFARGDRAAGRRRLRARDDELVLLFVGRVVREKNLHFLLRAVAPLLSARQDPPVRLVLVGDGPARESLQVLATQLGIAERVHFTGFVEQPGLPDYYAAGDIFVFASRTETQGVSLAEALAAGLPCVVVGAMGAAEAVHNGREGLIVPPHEHSFTAAVRELAENPGLREAMSKNARLAARQVSRAVTVERLLQLYQSLLDE